MTFAFNMASLPRPQMQALGGTADVVMQNILGHVRDAFPELPKGDPLTALAKKRLPLAVLLPADDHGFATRYLLACDALSTTQARFAFAVFERAFTEFGLPLAIRTDNGVPLPPNGALSSQQTGGVVAPARHSHRAHCPGPSAAKRPA